MSSLHLARVYQHSFQTRPNITLAITGGSLNALGMFPTTRWPRLTLAGDVVAQVSQKIVGLLIAVHRFYSLNADW